MSNLGVPLCEPYTCLISNTSLPGKPVAHNLRLLSVDVGLLWGNGLIFWVTWLAM